MPKPKLVSIHKANIKLTNQNGFAGSLLLLAFFIILASIGLVVYKQKPETDNTIAVNTKELSFEPKWRGNYSVELKYSKNSNCNDQTYGESCLMDIYLKDNSTGKESFLRTEDNIIKPGQGGLSGIRNGIIYIKKGIGTASKPPYQYKEQLWAYTDETDGILIVEGYQIGFPAISPDGINIAYTNESGTKVTTIINPKETKEISLDINTCISDPKLINEMGGPTIYQWNKNNNEVWGTYEGEYGTTGCFWKYDINTTAIKYFPLKEPQRMRYLNTEEQVAVYSDYPPFVEADSAEAWDATHKTYSYHIYDLKTGTSKVMVSVPISSTVTITGWVDDSTLQYSIDGTVKNYKLE